MGCCPMAPVYLEDFTVCKPPDQWLVDWDKLMEGTYEWKMSQQQRDFIIKVFKLVGMSPHRTYLPPWVNPQHINSPETSMDRAHEEALVTVVGTVQELLDKTGVHAGDIDIVVTACGAYCPTPSLSAMLVNKFGMRSDVISYSLGGMGCSSGVLGLQLVADLLQVYPGKRALFATAEMMTSGCYYGSEVPRYLSNTLFRAGGAAALLTNRPRARFTAKYRMVASTRSHGAGDNEAFKSVHFGPDKDGVNGLLLSRDLPKHAGRVLERCIRKTAPDILTWGQTAYAVMFYAKQAVQQAFQKLAGTKKATKPSRYVPDCTRCIDHFAIHAGGYVVVKAIQEGMGLPAEVVMPSMASLRDFGNTSVSLTWYAWAYCEAVQGVQRGHRVLQMGVGSGVKGAVMAWQALRDIPTNSHPAWSHLGGQPYTDADLPRSVMERPQTEAFLAKAMDKTANLAAT